MATVEEVRKRLREAGLVPEEQQLANSQVRLLVVGFDAVINIWPTGTCQVQGRDEAALKAALGDLVGKGKARKRALSAPPVAAATVDSSKKVFVVYGHDRAALDEVEAMLRRWGLDPQILSLLPSKGNTIIEKLEHYQEDVGWAVVLLTPDDLGYPALDPTKSAPRPRQNVVLEMGMLLGRLGRSHVAMLYKQSDPEMELPSDIKGYIYIPYTQRIQETAQELAKEMAAAGFYDVPHTKM